jgi:hypothetical protein
MHARRRSLRAYPPLMPHAPCAPATTRALARLSRRVCTTSATQRPPASSMQQASIRDMDPAAGNEVGEWGEWQHVSKLGRRQRSRGSQWQGRRGLRPQSPERAAPPACPADAAHHGACRGAGGGRGSVREERWLVATCLRTHELPAAPLACCRGASGAPGIYIIKEGWSAVGPGCQAAWRRLPLRFRSPERSF